MLIFVVILGRGFCLSETYHWPLGAKRGISATFGEFREGHFHAGVDLKTWGREGYPVYAVAKGWIWRLKTSPWGYGKAVYIKLADGKYTVYGHLSDYAPRIRREIEKEQLRQQRYSVEIFPPPGRISVQRGEVIGYSGSTGKGPPHLHFELRDSDSHPLNPLMCGLPVKDNRAPVLKSICLEPFSDSSLVDGLPEPKAYRFSLQKGIYRLKKIPQIWGRVGLAIDGYDLLCGSENRCGVYGWEIFLDGKLIFAKRYDHFSYQTSHQVYLDWDLPLLLRGKGYFSRLYLLPGNSLPLYSPTDSKGFIEELEPGYHLVKVLATDAAGNMSQALFKALVDQPPYVTKFECSQGRVSVAGRDRDGLVRETVLESLSKDGWRVVKKGQSRLELSLAPGRIGPLRTKVLDDWGVTSPYHYLYPEGGKKERGKPEFEVDLDPRWGYILLRVKSSKTLREMPHLQVSGQENVNLIPTGPQGFLASLPLVDSWGGRVKIKVEGEGLGGQKGELDTTISAWFIPAPGGKRIDGPGLRIEFPLNSIYQDLVVTVERAEVDIPLLLPHLREPFKIEPVDTPFDQMVEVSVKLPSGGDSLQMGLYYLKEGWEWVKGSHREEGRITSKVRHFSTYAVLLDTVRPQVWDLRPPLDSRLKNKSPLLRARVQDQGSGIGSDEDIRVMLDGKLVIAEWDPELESIKYRPRKPLSPGYHRLEIEVQDRVGNRTNRRSGFWILR